jgi:hypothetical protein
MPWTRHTLFETEKGIAYLLVMLVNFRALRWREINRFVSQIRRRFFHRKTLKLI